MGKAWTFFVACFVLLLLGSAWPAAAKTGGETIGGGTTGATTGGTTTGAPDLDRHYDHGNARIGASLSGTNTDGTGIVHTGQKLSGTKVELTFVINILKLGGFHEPAYDSSRIEDIKIYILGSTPDDTLANVQSDVDILASASAIYRFASTYFQHSASINVRVTATFKLTRGATTDTFPYDETFVFTAYNLMQSAGTDRDSAGTYNSTFDAISQATVGDIQTYAGYMKHGIDPSSVSDAMNQSASQIIAKSQAATAMMAVLHGSLTAIGDSHLSGSFTTSDITGQVSQKAGAGYPGFNVVYFWACETFDAGSSGWAGAYGIGGDDRAFLGYPDTIYLLCWSAEDWKTATDAGKHDPSEAGISYSRDVSDHAEAFLDHLTIGNTVAEAKIIADAQVPMVHRVDLFGGGTQFNKISTMISGDFLTRLHFVWLSTVERETIQSHGGSLDMVLVKLPIQ